MADNIYDVKVGDKLTPEQMREVSGVGANQGEQIAEFSATDEQNPEATDVPEESWEQKFFQWPENLKGDYPVRLMFTAYEIEPLSNNPLAEKASKYTEEVRKAANEIAESESVAEVLTNSLDAIGEVATSTIQTLKNTTGTSVSQFIKDTGNLNSYENFSAGGDAVGTVMLPMQRGITYSDGVNYQEASTNTGAGLIRALTPDGEGASTESGAITGATKGIAAQMAVKAATLAVPGVVGKLFGAGLLGAGAGFIAGEGISNAVRESTRVTTNPNIRTIFEGVNMRSFSFPFRMIAKSEKESQEIKKIIQFFRREVYPEAINVDETIPFAYKFPNIFEIMLLDSKSNTPAFKFQRCYLKSIDTVFNQTATGMYEGKDGKNYFIEVDMTLNFIEFSTLDKNKVREGF